MHGITNWIDLIRSDINIENYKLNSCNLLELGLTFTFPYNVFDGVDLVNHTECWFSWSVCHLRWLDIREMFKSNWISKLFHSGLLDNERTKFQFKHQNMFLKTRSMFWLLFPRFLHFELCPVWIFLFICQFFNQNNIYLSPSASIDNNFC